MQAGFGGVYGSGLARPQRGSSIVVGHESALRFWANLRRSNVEAAKQMLGELYPDDLLASLDAETVWSDCSLMPLELPHDAATYVAHALVALGLDGPLDVVVGKHGSRRVSRAARCHVWRGPVADGLVCCPEPGVYVVSPEVALLQVASSLGFYRTLALAMELCGTYSLDDSRSCEFDVAALTSPERIGNVVRLCEGVNGAGIMRKALPFVVANSASPRETALAILLGLTRKMGGWGCGIPKLNHRIELSNEARKQCGRSYLIADLFYDAAGLDIEYQGKEWHTSDEGRARDEARQNALMQMGVSCVFVSSEQLTDEAKMEGIAGLIRKRLGLRSFSCDESPKMREKRAEMLQALGL